MMNAVNRSQASVDPRARDTRGPSRRFLAIRCFVALVSIALSLAFGSRSSFADPTPLRADVLLARNGRVYVALADSGSVRIGDRLTLRSGKKTVATADVIALHDGALVVASVISGSLADTKKVSRLRVLHESRPVPRPTSLRAGFPSSARSNLLLPCPSVSIGPPFPSGGYRVDSLGARSYQLVRDAARPEGLPWPDTLRIRLFDEAADEEIALERGELDVAVFWPGELSPHMREDPRWRGFLRGARSRGALALLTTVAEQTAHALGSGSAPFRKLQALDRELFRGDLSIQPSLREALPLGSGFDSSFAGAFTVEPAIPGRGAIERFLNEPEIPGARGAVMRYRLIYLAGPEALAPSIQRLFPSGNGALAWYQPLSYPVVFGAELEPYLRALGAGALADLVDCRRAAEPR
jgi:hypothetical protein